MDNRIEKTIANLRKNRMQGIYAETKADVVKIVEEMLFEGAVITAGGSMSVKECGVWELINKPCYNFFDRSKSGITPEEQTQAFKAAIDCDFFFCSSNAVTENGELVNVDGFSNRISSIAFGPKKVIMVVGTNKIVKDVDEGILRVKKIAAPMNCVRLGIETPCYKLGHCVSLEKSDRPSITDGCNHPRRICDSYLICGPQRLENRITVIFCGEKLGY